MYPHEILVLLRKGEKLVKEYNSNANAGTFADLIIKLSLIGLRIEPEPEKTQDTSFKVVGVLNSPETNEPSFTYYFLMPVKNTSAN